MQYRTIEYANRKLIASMYAKGSAPKEIAAKIGVTPNSIYLPGMAIDFASKALFGLFAWLGGCFYDQNDDNGGGEEE